MKRTCIAAAAIILAAFTACSQGNPQQDSTETPAAAVTEQSTDPAVESEAKTTTEATTETTTPAPAETTTEFTTRNIPFEDTAQNAYDRLMASFETAEGTILPDNYAGTYSYFGTIYICLTDKDIPESYSELFSEYTCVKFQTVSHSLNELTRVSEEAAEILDAGFGVTDHSIDIPSNMATVTISKGDPKAAQTYLKTLEDLPFTLDELTILIYESEE